MAAFKRGGKKIKAGHVVLIVIGAAVLITAIAFFADAPERRELKELEIGSVDFSGFRDGSYTGEYAGKSGIRDASVEVTISGGAISSIKILKGALNSEGNPAELKEGMTMDDVFHRVIESKTLQVDAISGATLTTKAHLKALENALEKAREQ